MKTLRKLFTLGIIISIINFPVFIYSQGINEDIQKHKLDSIGKEAVKEQFALMRNDIKTGFSSVGNDGRYKISYDVMTIKDIDDVVKAKIEGRKTAIRNIIFETAKDIENNQYASVVFENNILSKDEQEEVKEFYNAVNENNISLRSLAMSIKMVVEISKEMYNSAINATVPQIKKDLYIEYTAFAHELSNIVVDLLENFEQKGVIELQSLYSKQKSIVDETTTKIKIKSEEYSRRFDSGNIMEENYKKKIKMHEDLISVLDESLAQWVVLFETIEKQKDWANNVQSKVQDFRDLRDDAGLQLEVLAVMGVTMGILDHFNNLGEITEIALIPLLSINIELVNDLFRTDIPKDMKNKSLKLNTEDYEN